MPSTVFLDRALKQRNPESFGRYQLLGRLAFGGMAEVFVARCGELAGLQTLIALKRILPVHAQDDSFVRMFQREAAIALRLNHASIARVFEVGRVGDSWFLSMELVQGENLARISKKLALMQMRWPAGVLAYVGAEVARALHYAHNLKDAKGRTLGIVHRDISPENVMCGFDGSIKVIDFGIALCEAHARETTAGAVRGKAQYVSPEQAMGRDIDGRSDLFSLGVVLYEALAGRHPFDRGGAMATLDAVVRDSIDPIPQVSQALNAVLTRALSKDPDRRYQTGDEMARDLLATLPRSEHTGAADVQELTTSLFPGRTSRWRMIQESAGTGRALPDELERDGELVADPSQPKVTAPSAATTLVASRAEASRITMPSPSEPKVATKTTSHTARVDPPGYVGTITASIHPRGPSSWQGLLVAAASGALVVLIGVYGFAALRPPTADLAIVAPETTPRDKIMVEPLEAPVPPPPPEMPPPQPPAQTIAPKRAADHPVKRRPIAKRGKQTTAKHGAIKRKPPRRR